MPLQTAQQGVKSLEKKHEGNSSVSLPELALADKATFGELMGYSLPPHQEEWCDIISLYNRLVLLAPAGHGKTTVFSLINPLHEIAKDRHIRIGLCTNVDTLAESIQSAIQENLENNQRLIEAYGDFKPKRPKKWNKWQTQIENGGMVMNTKDATVTAFGAMSAIKGARFDLLLIDDFIDEKNTKTQEKRDEIWKWFWGTLIPRLEKPMSSPVKIMGTVEHEDDAYHRFMDSNRGFHVVQQQAIVDEQEKKVLWPGKIPFDELSKLRDASYTSFMKTYQNIVVGNEVAKISQAKIDACYDSSRTMYPHHIPDEERQRYKLILMGVDPAWTKKRRSKYSVILTLGFTHDKERVVLDIFREKVEYDQLYGWIKTKHGNLRPHVVLVESNNMQHTIAKELNNAAIYAKPVWTSENKNDINVGIPMLYSVISAGKLRVPSGDQASAHLSGQLMSEILAYPFGQYSDILMALYFCEQEIRKRSFVPQASQKSTVTGRSSDGSRFSKRYTNVWHLAQ